MNGPLPLRGCSQAGFHTLCLRLSDDSPVHYTEKLLSSGAIRRSEPGAHPKHIQDRLPGLNLDSDGFPVYDPDPFMRVESHGIVHLGDHSELNCHIRSQRCERIPEGPVASEDSGAFCIGWKRPRTKWALEQVVWG